MSPKRDQTDSQHFTMCCKRIIALKHRHIFLWAITLNTIKTLSTGYIYTPHISGQMALSRPPWPVFLIDFAQNPLLECKQLRDTDSHSRVNIRFQQSDESNLLLKLV